MEREKPEMRKRFNYKERGIEILTFTVLSESASVTAQSITWPVWILEPKRLAELNSRSTPYFLLKYKIHKIFVHI